MLERKKRILIDFDSTIANSVESIIKLYSKRIKKDINFQVEKLQWDFTPFIPPEDLEWALNQFTQPQMYEILKPIENSIEVLRRMSEKYELVIVTNKHPKAANINQEWINKYFKGIFNKVIFINQSDLDKSLIEGDIIIDDKIENILGGTREYRILFGNTAYSKFKNFSKETIHKIIYGKQYYYKLEDWISVEKFLEEVEEQRSSL